MQRKMKRNKSSKKNKLLLLLDARILVLIIILVVIVLANVVINIFFEADEGKDNFLKNNSLLKFQDCLEKENNMSKECLALISQIGSEKNCENIPDYSNECYYKLAVYTHRGQLCYKINDDKLKRECNLNSEPYQGA